MDITSKIKNFEDALEYTGETIEQFNARTANDGDDEKAYKELKVIALALNEGKRMDYTDTQITKYFPWFWSVGSGVGFSCFGSDFVYSHSYVGSRLCVDSSKKAKYFGKQFLTIWDRYING